MQDVVTVEVWPEPFRARILVPLQTPVSKTNALSGERTPGFDTILKVMKALDLKIHAEAVA